MFTKNSEIEKAQKMPLKSREKRAPLMIIYQNPEDLTGSPLVFAPSPENVKSNEALIAQIVPTGMGYKLIEKPEDFTLDRVFLDAWRWGKDKFCKIDMGQAREIHRDKLKRLRYKKWKVMGVLPNMNPALDSLFSPEEQEILKNLRDINTYNLDGHTSTEDLKKDIPEYLK